jgi:uncharacterized membrane protein
LDPLKQDRLRVIKLPWLFVMVLLLVLTVLLVIANGWQAHARDWLSLVVRWLHIIYGTAWIGASFYFIFLENSLEREAVRPELAGKLWSLHGGGIYYLEKYRTAPATFPKILHWFKWDAYLTWLTGFLLLIMVYYSNPQALLLNPESKLSGVVAVALGLGSLVLAWLVYVALSRTALLNHAPLFALTGLLFMAAAAWLLSQIFSGRGAFIQVGAMLGTIMSGNVLFVLIPSQKLLVRAVQKGETLDPAFINRVQLRSRHNNYLTLPVLFTMISNHYPVTYSYSLNWLILSLLFVAGVAVRHSINVTEKQHQRSLTEGGALPYLLVLALAIIIAAFYLTAPKGVASAAAAQVSFAQVQAIMAERCVPCHAAQPSQAGFAAAPAGIMLETPEQISVQLAKIKTVTVDSTYMPLGNLTSMTDEERAQLGTWLAQGARME